MTGQSRLTAQIVEGLVGDVRVAAGGGDLDGFLATAGVAILDVTRGAAADTRRLLLGDPEAQTLAYSVAVADHADAAPAIDSEVRMLSELRSRVSPDVLTTLPGIVARVAVGDRPGVVMTAASGRLPRRRDDAAPDPGELAAVGSWLDALWHTTSGLPGPVDLGRQAADELLARCVGLRRLSPALGAVHHARLRIGRLQCRRTAMHGCLCPRHVQVRDGAVTGVDDWGRAGFGGEPLRDLGSYAVRSAGPRLADAVADRSEATHPLRDFVRAGLTGAGLPADGWRDVLVLAQVERAVDDLEHGRVDEIGRLAAMVDALPPDLKEPEADL
jgi:hypothetical protein